MIIAVISENSHGLSSCYVTGPGLDALSTLNILFSNQQTLIPNIDGKMETLEYYSDLATKS